jgi:glutathione S-transferase
MGCNMLTIWGRENSINVQRALWCADEIGLAYERIDAGMEYGVNNTPAYLDMNPTGRIPTIRDGDYVLWESAAIVRYFAAKYSSGFLYPVTAEERGIADQWMGWNTWWIHPPLTTAFWGLVRSPGKHTEEEISTAVGALAEKWLMLERHLAGSAFVAGKSFSYGDIVPACSWYRYQAMIADRPATPSIDRWYSEICERPVFRKRVMLPLT